MASAMLWLEDGIREPLEAPWERIENSLKDSSCIELSAGTALSPSQQFFVFPIPAPMISRRKGEEMERKKKD